MLISGTLLEKLADIQGSLFMETYLSLTILAPEVGDIKFCSKLRVITSNFI